MNWQAKYLVQRGLSLMSFGMGNTINHWLSSNFGGLRDSPEYALPNTLGIIGLLSLLDPRQKAIKATYFSVIA